MITNIDKVVYNAKYFWNIKYNPNATIQNALPNCTTCAYGLIVEDKHLPCVSIITNANEWHKYLINGWSAMDYDPERVEVGDILQWQKKCHVAAVTKEAEGRYFVSASFYTGEHGKAVYDGSFDTRNSFTSLKQLSDFMLENYPKRYFHCWDIQEECKYVGGLPEKILKAPLYSVGRNTSRDQIEVLTFVQNVRNKENNILQKAEKGFFNIKSKIEMNGYLWYEVEKGKYIAQVDGRVIYHEATSEDDIEELKKENARLKKLLKEINKLSEV